MGVDVEGRSVPFALFLVTEETEDNIIAMLELFKEDNPHWVKTLVVLTDKYMKERGAFKKAMPQNDLQLGFCHVTRAFSQKRNIHAEIWADLRGKTGVPHPHPEDGPRDNGAGIPPALL